MDIAIIGVATRGYGKFVEQWLDGILCQHVKPREIILVLGFGHSTTKETLKKLKKNKVKIIMEKRDLTLGTLLNKALYKAKSKWVLRVDIDDVLLPIALEEVKKKYDTVDAVALKFKLGDTIKDSPIVDINKLNCCKKDFNESGYVANKIKHGKDILYYEDNDFPNFPYLFYLASKGFKFCGTDNVCVEYNQDAQSQETFLKARPNRKVAHDIIDTAAMKYRVHPIILTIMVTMYNSEDLILRSLKSIELREDVEVIMIDDCSVDNTAKIAKQWMDDNPNKNISFYQNNVNKGSGATMNVGYNNFKGEYIMILCDDDYLIEPLSSYIPFLDGTDLVYYDLVTNTGSVWDGTKLSGSSKAFKRSIIGDTRRIDQNFGGDKVFYKEILAKRPTKKTSRLSLYHYNYPRKGSQMDLWKSNAEEVVFSQYMDITIFTIAYNGYGRYLPTWILNMRRQLVTPKKVVIVLGKNHGADLEAMEASFGFLDHKIIFSESDNMGELRNEAVRVIDTEWQLYFSADDKLLPNAVQEIQKQSNDFDAVALRFMDVQLDGKAIESYSMIVEPRKMFFWKTIEPVPGYIAVKHKWDGEVLYYDEDLEVPNVSYLFKLAYLGLRITETARKETVNKELRFEPIDNKIDTGKKVFNECAIYTRRRGSHGDKAAINKDYLILRADLDVYATLYFNLWLEKLEKQGIEKICVMALFPFTDRKTGIFYDKEEVFDASIEFIRNITKERKRLIGIINTFQ